MTRRLPSFSALAAFEAFARHGGSGVPFFWSEKTLDHDDKLEMLVGAIRGVSKIRFEIDPFRKHLLLNGLDDIGQTLQHAPSIDSYEAKQKAEKSWMPGIEV